MIELEHLKNSLKDEDIYILGNGPSILDFDLDFLNGKNVIGINASTLLEEQYNFKQKFYTISDTRFIKHEEKSALATTRLNCDTIRIMRKEQEPHDDKNYAKRTIYLKGLGINGFSYDLNKGFYDGLTTAHMAVQLAYYLGAKNIYLLGVDLIYPKNGKRFYHEKRPQTSDFIFRIIQIFNLSWAYRKLKKKNINLYSCSSISLLNKFIPYKDIGHKHQDENTKKVFTLSIT